MQQKTKINLIFSQALCGGWIYEKRACILLVLYFFNVFLTSYGFSHLGEVEQSFIFVSTACSLKHINVLCSAATLQVTG